MNILRFLTLFGFLKPRKTKAVAPGAALTDGDGTYLVDEDGNKLTG